MIQQGSKFRLITDYPIAVDSPDHIVPYGTMHNNNHSQGFIDKLHELYPKPLSILDLGCAGGHNIYQHNLQGDDACGLEGSDYRKTRNMDEWNKETNLFTCDITKPFIIDKWDILYQCFISSKFDCISMWECLEHLKEEDLPQLYSNVKQHLKSNGVFLGSICVFDEERRKRTYGIEWGPNMHHQTIYPREWWWEHFEKNGFKIRWDLVDFFGKNVVRGPGVNCGEDCTVNFYLEFK